jgi:hypothetical protein
MEKDIEQRKKQAYGIGLSVFILLGFLTIGEFFLGSIAATWWVPLLGVAVLKAFFVVREYMHIGRLFVSVEEEE